MDADHVERGLAQRPRQSGDLFRVLAACYSIRPSHEARDLGGSSTLNLLVKDDGKRCVVRVYGPWLTTGRLAAMQDTRRFLAAEGIPCALPVPTRNGSS